MINRNLVMVIILAVVFTGCSQQYSAEKAFYQANKYSADIFKDPAGIPPYKFEKALADFHALINKYPDTRQAIESYFIIGNIYVLQGRNGEAISLLRKVMVHYPSRPELAARTMMAIANCYEKDNQWNTARRIYREAFDKYPDVPGTISVPMYILDHYIRNKDINNRDLAQQQAVRDYNKLIAKYPYTKLAYTAKNLLTEVYMRGGAWADVLATLNDLIKNYPQSPEVPTWIMTMAATYEVKFNNKTRAGELYRMLMTKYNRSPWAKEAEKRLQELKP
jgi:TolA-binding protein